jgi:Na+/melibiose symporter-like transporter
MAAIFFGLFGLLIIVTLAIGLFGLLFKNNRNDKEYVDGVKSVGWTAFQWFILAPVAVIVAVILFAYCLFS